MCRRATDNGGRWGHRRTGDKWIGALIIALASLLSLAVAHWARSTVDDRKVNPTAKQLAARLPGWPHAVDPLRVLGDVRAASRLDGIRAISAAGVRPDGTVDLRRTGYIRYTFQGTPRAKAASRATSPGSGASDLVCPRESVYVSKDGLIRRTQGVVRRCGAGAERTLPEPGCSLAELWDAAQKEGLRAEGVAEIEYFRSSEGPRWRFRPSSEPRALLLSADCRSVATPSPSRRSRNLR